MTCFTRMTRLDILHAALRTIQIFSSLAVLSFYLPELLGTSKAAKFDAGLWMYATVLPILSILVALAYLFPRLARIRFLWVVDIVVFSMWALLFALFAMVYMQEVSSATSEGHSKIYFAMWYDVANAGIWLVGAIAMISSSEYHFHNRVEELDEEEQGGKEEYGLEEGYPEQGYGREGAEEYGRDDEGSFAHDDGSYAEDDGKY